MWYTAALSDGIIQSGGTGLDNVVLSGDGLTHRIPQLAVFLASTPQTFYASELDTTGFEGLVS